MSGVDGQEEPPLAALDAQGAAEDYLEPGPPVCERCGADSHTACAASGCPGTWDEPSPSRSLDASASLSPAAPAADPRGGLPLRAIRARIAALAIGGGSPRPWATWLGALAVAAAFAYALASRLAFLDAKPLHHDEGVNAHFLFGLVTHGRYHYDPTNYHGPFLYFFGASPFAAFGATPLGLRLLPALCGAATLLLLVPLRRVMGWAGVACAAWLIALSPIATYVSRTAIHESYFVFAVLAGVVCCVTYAERARAWIPSLAGLALALAYANKETAVISYGAYACGLGLALLGGRELSGNPWVRTRAALRTIRATYGEARAGWYQPVPHWVIAVAYLLGIAAAYLISMGARLLVYGAWLGVAEEQSENSFLVWDKLSKLLPPALVVVLWVGLPLPLVGAAGRAASLLGRAAREPAPLADRDPGGGHAHDPALLLLL